MPGPPPNDALTGSSGLDPVTALTTANNAAGNKVDPKTVVGVVKSSQSVGDAVDNVQAIAHTGNVVKMYDTLQGMDPSSQASAWQAMSPGEQSGLKSVGYSPPDLGALHHAGAGGQHGGIWSDVESIGKSALGGVDRVAHDVNIGQVPGRVANDVLSAAGAPLRAVQHVERASLMVANAGQNAAGESIQSQISGETGAFGALKSQFDPNSWSKMFSPSAWAQGWRETTDGNTTLLPAVHREMINHYGQDQVSLAIRASAEGNDGIVNAAPATQRQALITQLNDPKFQELVKEVGAAKMSPGREVVGTQFQLQHPGEAKLISGGLDAAIDVVSDPALHAGKIGEAAKVARYGFKDASSAEDIIRNSPGVQRYVKQVSPLLEQERYGELAKIDPKLDAIAPQLAQENINSGAKFTDWLASEMGMKAMLSGDAAKVSHGVSVIPHLSYLGWMKAGVKDALSSSMDRLADGKPSELVGDTALDGDEVMGTGDPIHASPVQSMTHLLETGQMHGDVGKIPGVSNVARLVRRLTTNIPDKPFIDISDPSASNPNGADVQNFRRYVQGFLPAKRVDDLTNVFTGSDEGQRRLLVTAATKQLLHSTGLYNTPESSTAADAFMDEMTEMTRKQAYSVNGLDGLPGDDGLISNHAVLETQKAPGMSIPLPHQIRQLVRDNSILGTMGVHPLNGVDRVMSLWRSMILDRPGFAARMALDENLNRLLRSGPKKLVGSFLANGAARQRTDEDIAAQVEREVAEGTTPEASSASREASLRAMDVKPLLPYHPIDRALQIMAERAPEGLRPLMKNASEFYGGVLGGTTRKWARAAERGGLKAFGLDDYVEGATHMMTHQEVHDAMEDKLAAGTGAEGYQWGPESQLKAVKTGDKAVIARFNKNAPYSEALPSDPLFRFKWQVGLDQIAHSKLGRAVLETIDRDPRTQQAAVMRVLNDPSFAAEKKGLVWSTKLRDGRTVGIDATQSEADRSYARQIVDHVNAHVRTGVESGAKKGPVLSDLVDHMLEHGAAPDQDMLDEIGSSQLPRHVYGPDVVQVKQFSNFMHRSFEEMVGKPMNWMSRQPHFIHQYTDALRQTRPFAQGIMGEGENAEKLASDLAYQRALKAMTPYIHNPELRTQFEDVHRNLFPFLFAQRQFLQRWGRTFADSPSAIRELQLTMNGLRTSGIIKKDSNGQDYFYYPGAQYVTEMLSHTLSRIGVHATVPFAAPFTGEVQYLMPGLSNPTTPSVGPFAAVAVNELTKLFPEMQGFQQGLLGQGAGEGPVNQFLPTIVNRLYEALGPAEAGTQLASTTMQYMKYMDANGQGLPNNPKPGQIEQYVARVQTGARELLVVRAMLGFTLPATPNADLDPKNLSGRLNTLLSQLPYDQAVTQFIKENPDGGAYTVSESEGLTGGGLPSTKAVEDFTNAHADFARAYPSAFPWLAPRQPGTFDLTTFAQQLNLGERVEKPLYDPIPGHSSFSTDIIDARASSTYYNSVDAYEKQYGAVQDSTTRSQLTNAWDSWKQQFFQRNPIFGQYIASEAGHQTRVATLDQVQAALNDPKVPDSPVVPELRTMMESYNNFTSEYDNQTGTSSQTYTAKTNLKAAMVQWGNQYTTQNKNVSDFWTTVLRPEIDDA